MQVQDWYNLYGSWVRVQMYVTFSGNQQVFQLPPYTGKDIILTGSATPSLFLPLSPLPSFPHSGFAEMNALMAQRKCPWQEICANPGFLGWFPYELLAWLPWRPANLAGNREDLHAQGHMHRDRWSSSGPFPGFWSAARFGTTGYHTLSSRFYCTFFSLQHYFNSVQPNIWKWPKHFAVNINPQFILFEGNL